MANAKARLSASFTRRPNGKWKMTFRFPLTSRYPSRRTCRSVGRDGINASCSWTYETRDCAEPASTWYSSINHSFAAFSPSLAFFAARSRRNSPTAIERSNRSEEHTSELQSRLHLVCRLLLEKKNTTTDLLSA